MDVVILHPHLQEESSVSTYTNAVLYDTNYGCYTYY